MTRYADLSTEDLLLIRSRCAATCERVMAMPEAERRTAGVKGAVPPEQSATLQAVIVTMIERELFSRGAIDKLSWTG